MTEKKKKIVEESLPSKGEIIFYKPHDGGIALDAKLEEGELPRITR